MEIPECLVPDILTRLPITSTILRFRSVCKSWYAILSNPATDLFTVDPDYQILYKHHQDQTGEVFSIISFNSPDQSSPPKELPRVNRTAGYTEIGGCCNGIVLLKDDYLRMCLWNPATEETKMLPEFNLFRDDRNRSRSHYVGLCFDAKTGDFKVILVFCPTNVPKRDFVYSLRSDNWKRVKPRSPRAAYNSTSDDIAMNSSNGMCHWFGSYLVEKRYREMILSFDANHEIFKTTITPYSRKGGHSYGKSYRQGFFMLKDCVAMFRKEKGKETEMYEIWAMWEVGVEESWIKVTSIGLPLPLFDKVLRFWDNGKVFLEVSGNSVEVFDPCTGQTSPFLMKNKYMPLFQLASNYKKSQVQLRELVARHDAEKLIFKRPRTN